MKKIILNNKQFALVDDEDFEKLNQYKWYFKEMGGHAKLSKSNGYAITTFIQNGKKINVYMQRMVIDKPKAMDIDHINGNRLDNRKENLRICSHRQNMMNERVYRPTKTGYRGVSPAHKTTNKFVAHIKIEGKITHLGTFKTPIEAAKAYNDASKKYHGEFGILNNISS